MRLVSAEQMVELERAADAAGHAYDRMMQLAGEAVAREIEGRWPPGRALVLAGPGNNGGDGLVCATALVDAGWTVAIAAWRRGPDRWMRAAVAHDIPVCHVQLDGEGVLEASHREQLAAWLSKAHLVVDALLGTGLARPLAGAPAALLDALRAERARRKSPGPNVVAVDVPTGLYADDGSLDPRVVPADLTVTFGAVKRGQLLYPGAGALGRLLLDPIGIPSAAERSPRSEEPGGHDRVATAAEAARGLPPRSATGHKGSFGRLLVLAGAAAYPGAALLAARAGGRAGAGHVTLAAIPEVRTAIAAGAPEVTHLALPAAGGAVAEEAAEPVAATLADCDALLVGCGLTSGTGPTLCVHSLLADARLPLLSGRILFDADGLNILARDPALLHALPAPSVLTPHPGEMARLLGRPVAEVLSDRLGAARDAATEWGHVVVLKGAPTVIASPEGACSLLPIATAALASAGTGDVLAGLIGGLLAQGAAPTEAAITGATVHGLAGLLAASDLGQRAPVATDLLLRIGTVLAALDTDANGPQHLGPWKDGDEFEAQPATDWRSWLTLGGPTAGLLAGPRQA